MRRPGALKARALKGCLTMLTMGPGLAEPPGLHWLLTGEFLFAVERTEVEGIMMQQSPTPLLKGPPPTCHNVSDGFDERGEGGDVGLAVLPHGLPYHQTAGQTEGQIRLLEKKNTIKKTYQRYVRSSFLNMS